MNEKELLERIKEIVFYVPGEIYKFSQPDNCFDEEWEEASLQEKAFLLIEDLLINLNREQLKKDEKQSKEKVLKMRLSNGPRFFSVADENMFFNALYSIPSIVKIKGERRELFLYYINPISHEEKDFLKGLLKRYQISIPSEFQE